MKHSSVLLLLTCWRFFLGATAAASFFPSQKSHYSSLQQQRRRAQRLSSLDAIAIVRGGASIEESSKSSNILVTKFRNVIRSLLEITERKSPSLAKLARSLLGSIEKMTGVSLLPPKKKKQKKSAKSTTATKKKTKSAAASDDDSTAATKKKKSHHVKLDSTASKHVSKKLTQKDANYRIQKELKEFLQNPPPNLRVKVGSNIRVWIIIMTGAANTLYEGETFRLRVQFPPAYPTVPPSVYFLPPTPQHEHVYTNGDICLSLLGKGWRPTMTAQSIAVSILSILSSAQTKSIPMDNARHSQNKPGQYQKDWVYHDDNC